MKKQQLQEMLKYNADQDKSLEGRGHLEGDLEEGGREEEGGEVGIQ